MILKRLVMCHYKLYAVSYQAYLYSDMQYTEHTVSQISDMALLSFSIVSIP